MLDEPPIGRPRLLVSVRDTDEARAAIAGGADVIDVKDPSRGPLGMAAPSTIRAIVALGRDAGRPVTAALGELVEWDVPNNDDGGHPPTWWTEPTLLKVGLAGVDGGWCDSLARMTGDAPRSRWIGVAYADHLAARSPEPEAVVEGCAALGCGGVLVDTYDKTDGRLLDHLPVERLAELISRIRARGLTVALAGRLTADDVSTLATLEPDVIGVRSAACRAGDRGAVVEIDRVRGLVEVLADRRGARQRTSPEL